MSQPNTPSSLPALRGLLFDLDGTLTRPLLDFDAIRREIGIPQGHTLLEYIAAHLDEAQTARAHAIIDEHEMRAAHAAEPNTGYEHLRAWLAEQARRGSRGLPVGIITRNSRKAAAVTLQRLAFPYDSLVTREDCAPKPDPASVHLALATLRLAPPEAALIGDFRYDVLAGKAAAVARTVFVHNGDHTRDHGGADTVVAHLGELPQALTTFFGA